MSKPRKGHGDMKRTWVCEYCETPVQGDDPPDECPKCAHKYFDNLDDLVWEAQKAALVK